jgi:polyisoprenyl-teichoic acid--peptidoglycan teichoic acid transferase
MSHRPVTQGSMESEQKEGIGQQVGRKLRLARERQGQSLEELERVLTIHAHHLDALERGEFDRLPSPLWARGFLITYTEHLGLKEEELVDQVFPLRRLSRPKGYLKRHWRALIATFGAIGVAAAITGATTIIAPYNPVTGQFNEFLHQIAPDTFLGSGPERIAILGFTGSGIAVEGNVMVTSITQDGFGLLSIPDNTLVEMSGQRTIVIGDASTQGEFDLARRSAAQLTGVEVPHYLVVSPEGIKEIVDAMGGVRIDVQNPLSGQARAGGPELTLGPGLQVLNGDQTLVYLQGSDLRSSVERAERQQVFLRAMFSQALGPANLLSHPATLDAMREHAETNMGSAELIQLTGRVRALKDSGASLEVATVPGRKGAAYPNQDDTQNSYWIPDARRLPGVVKETVR